MKNKIDYINSLRIFPRIFITVYIYMFYTVVEWFMDLPDPTNAQAGLVSVVVGAGAAWFGLYVNTGNQKATVFVETTKDGSTAEFESEAKSADYKM